jgi:hypothetical protein
MEMRGITEKVPRNRKDKLSMALAENLVSKITIPAGILSRPGKINPDQMAIMRTHTEAGSDILQLRLLSVTCRTRPVQKEADLVKVNNDAND